MRKLSGWLVALLIVLSTAQFGFACTSFAVYGRQGPVIGMNIDIPAQGEVEGRHYPMFEDGMNRIAITYYGDTKVFSYDHNFFFSDRGVFGCIQFAWPPQRMYFCEKRVVNWYDLFAWGTQFLKAADVVRILEQVRLRHFRETDFHCLFADSQGNALIVEPGAYDNYLLPMEGPYIVMTNFFHQYLQGDFAAAFAQEYPGEDLLAALDYDGRYRRAEALIQSSLHDFDYTKALEVLEAVAQHITKFSVVIVPSELKIYFALFRDFSRIWQVDLAEETIATYQGFAQHRTERLDVKGWTVKELMGWQ